MVVRYAPGVRFLSFRFEMRPRVSALGQEASSRWR